MKNTEKKFNWAIYDVFFQEENQETEGKKDFKLFPLKKERKIRRRKNFFAGKKQIKSQKAFQRKIKFWDKRFFSYMKEQKIISDKMFLVQEINNFLKQGA